MNDTPSLSSSMWSAFLPFLIIGGILCGGAILFALWKRRRLVRSGIFEVDRMEGIAFERYLEALFQQLGFHVRRTRAQGDYGGDVLISRDGTTTVVQAKRYKQAVG